MIEEEHSPEKTHKTVKCFNSADKNSDKYLL